MTTIIFFRVIAWLNSWQTWVICLEPLYWELSDCSNYVNNLSPEDLGSFSKKLLSITKVRIVNSVGVVSRVDLNNILASSIRILQAINSLPTSNKNNMALDPTFINNTHIVNYAICFPLIQVWSNSWTCTKNAYATNFLLRQNTQDLICFLQR